MRENQDNKPNMRKKLDLFNRNVQKLDYSRVVNVAAGDLMQ